MRPKRATCCLLLALASSAWSEVSQQVVSVVVAKQGVDFNAPWTRKNLSTEQHVGTVVRLPHSEELRILTTAYAVNNASQLTMHKFFTNDSYSLDLDFADYEANLALLKPRHKDAWHGLSPMPLGGDLEFGTNVILYSPQDSGKLVGHEGSVSSIGVYEATTSAYQMLHYLFKVQKKALGWSEPVILAGKLVAISSGQGTDYIYGIPATTIRHFIRDQSNPTYRGFPTLGFQTKALTSSTMRRALRADHWKEGVAVSRVDRGSRFSAEIREHDILLAVNGKPVKSNGTIHHQEWGDLPYIAALNQMYGEDEVTLSLGRDGKTFSVAGTMERFDSNTHLIPYYLSDAKVPHLIFAGLVFQELTKGYLEEWGSGWENTAKSNLLFTWHFENLRSKSGKRIILLNRVLADEFNHGYDKLENYVLVSVNGKNVDSLIDLMRALDQAEVKGETSFARLLFSFGGGEVILSYENLATVNGRIMASYGVHDRNSFYWPTDTKAKL